MTTTSVVGTAASALAASPTLIPLTDLEGLRAGIRYPATVDGLRWLYRVRQARGFEKAFRRVGRRILVDVPAFAVAIREGE